MAANGGSYTDSPLVDRLASTLAERIYTGQYQGQDGFPSERALTVEFGVSRVIVRRALETLEQQSLLLRSPRCRTIVRNPQQTYSASIGQKRRSLGLWIWPAPTDPGTAAVVQGICQALDHDRYRLVIGHNAWHAWEEVRQAESRFLKQMIEDQDISGILLWYLGGNENLPALRKVRAANIPVVFMDRVPPREIEADYVGVDNAAAAERVVQHLIERGHRRIAHITNLDNASTVVERLQGYQRALQMASIPFRPELVVTATEETFATAPAAHGILVERLRALPDPPTAVFAANDVLADRFLTALRARGLRVPEDIALAGFDGLERWATAEPFLTTVYQPFEQLGNRAMKTLLQRIEADPTAPYRHILLDTDLRIHGSTLTGRRVAL